MTVTDTGSDRMYDSRRFPNVTREYDDDATRRWGTLPHKSRKEYAAELVDRLLLGEKKRQAHQFLRARRFSEETLERFIVNMENGLRARDAEEENGSSN